LAQRPLVLNYVAQLIQRKLENDVTWIGFEDLFNNFKNAIPRLIYRGKGDVLVAEPFYAERTGLPYTDNAESLPFSALASFGLLGLIIYPLLCWLYVNVTLAVILSFRSDRIMIAGTAAMMWLFLSGWEMSVCSIFVVPRNIIIAALVIKFVEFPFGNSRPLLRAPRLIQITGKPGSLSQRTRHV
jgi:hypothetical protein